MTLKEEYNKLVETVKRNSLAGGVKLTKEAIAAKLKISRTHLSGLLSGKEVLTERHIEDFKLRFANELNGIVKPSLPGNELNRERALIKVLYQELAKLKAEKLGVPVDKVLDELDRDTMIAWRELEGME